MGRNPKNRDTPSADMIEVYRERLVAANRSPRTIRSVLEVLYRLDRELEKGLAAAMPEELIHWLARPEWSASTKATLRAHIVGFFGWATDDIDPWLTYNPAARLPRPTVRPGVPDPADDEWVKLCVTEAGQPWRRICTLAAYAGLRPIEIAALRRQDVTERWIRTVGKGNKPAIIPTEPPVWREIRDLPPGPVILKPNGKQPDAHWVSVETAKYLRLVLEIHTSLRHFRHWHGTWLRRHYDLRTVQERMRHASLATTQVYTAVTEAELLSSVGALPDFTATGPDGPADAASAVAPGTSRVAGGTRAA